MNAPFRKPEAAPRTKPRKLYPLPVECIMRHPAIMALPSAGFGGLMRIVFHFWDTECRPLPAGHSELQYIARCHGPTWATHRKQILAVFEDVRPELEAYFRLRQVKGTTVKNMARAAGKASAARAALLYRFASVSKKDADRAAGLTPINNHMTAAERNAQRDGRFAPKPTPDLKAGRRRFQDA